MMIDRKEGENMTKSEYMESCGIKIKSDKPFLHEEADDSFKDICDQVCEMVKDERTGD